jgi:hypothetical protein
MADGQEMEAQQPKGLFGKFFVSALQRHNCLFKQC